MTTSRLVHLLNICRNQSMLASQMAKDWTHVAEEIAEELEDRKTNA